LGGPFRAIVGGAAQKMSFAPAQAIRSNNYSTQYGHLIEIDEYIAPGQIGQVTLLDGQSSLTFKFEAPPGASQAAPTVGQICLLTTYERDVAPGAAPPLGPSPGLILPIGLDSPQHLHHFAGTHAHNPHLHAHSAAHNHGIGGDATGSSGHTHASDPGTHLHATYYGAGGVTGPASAGTAHTHGYNDPNLSTASTAVGTGFSSPGAGSTQGETGHSHNHSHGGGTGNAAPGNTDNANVPSASPGDSDLENLQHTHP
jgi:hypothetical protein